MGDDSMIERAMRDGYIVARDTAYDRRQVTLWCRRCAERGWPCVSVTMLRAHARVELEGVLLSGEARDALRAVLQGRRWYRCGDHWRVEKLTPDDATAMARTMVEIAGEGREGGSPL